MGENPCELSGIGVSATGQVDVESGVVIGGSGFIKNWNGTPIKARLESEFGLETTVINDANAVAVAEQKFGSAAGCDDAVVVTLGTGVGGGIITGGRLLLGHRGIGGEIGHFSIQHDGLPCPCGSRGCLERYASVTALAERIRSAPGLAGRLHLEEINGRTIFAHMDDPEVAEIVSAWINCLASGIVSLVHIFNPQAVVIGGGISREQTLLMEPLKERVLKTVMPCFAQGLRIVPARLGNSAGLIGAVAYLL